MVCFTRTRTRATCSWTRRVGAGCSAFGRCCGGGGGHPGGPGVGAEPRRRLVETVLAAARQDVDGVINGFYELGILDPDVDRGTVRDAAQSLMAVSLKDETSPRQIQRLGGRGR